MTTPGAGRDVEGAIDGLYRAPLDQFTAQRNALAAELRKAGDRENADRVKTLPKPGATAWAVNQAWWREQAAFQEMLDAGEALRSAHLALAKGSSADVRSAAEARQRAVDRVIDAAVQALGGPGDVGHDVRHRIAGTVEALASSGAPPDVAVGRLSKDLQSSGLDVLSALAGMLPASKPTAPPPRPVIVSRTPAPAASKAETRADAKAEAAARDRAAKISSAKTHLADCETALRAASADATTSASAEKKARTALDAAAARVKSLEEKLEAGHEEERAARRALAQATKMASEAEMIRARTARDVNGAREQLDALKDGGL